MLSNFEILDSVSESMAVINSSGEILFTNKAWQNFSAGNKGNSNLTGMHNNYLNICKTVKGEESDMAKQAYTGILSVINKESELFELEYPCHSPTEKRWFILRASGVLINPDLTLLAHINITNRKNAELEVEKNYSKSREVNRALNRTVYKIAHDIQNPLASIMSLVDLSKSATDMTAVNKFLGMIEKGSTNLHSFITETLEHISVMDEMQSIKVDKLVSLYLETIEPLLTVHDIDVQVDIKQNNEFITDAIEFRSILSNLIGNAIKYSDNSKAEKKIIVTFSLDSEAGILRIKDNGLGIKPEHIPRIMERNFQVNKDSSTSKGAGFGLFMIERAIRRLGGTISVNSDFGVGTEFVVTLPNAGN